MIKTHTKTSSSLYIIKASLLCIVLLHTSSLYGQVVWENPKNEIYNFLSRQAQKGNISFSDVIRPVSRKVIASHLSALQDSVQNLSNTERKELAFYQKEYSEFDSNMDTFRFLKKDTQGRWRALSIKQKDFVFQVDPIISVGTVQGTNTDIFRKASGLTFWGHASAHIAFQASFQDITESGTGLDSLKQFTPETGIVRTTDVKPDTRTLNYSDLKGYISYSWENGSLSLGKDQLLQGYGENGRLILSDKAPSYPFIRLDYQPLKWLSFNYTHSWLHSSIIDSSAIYNKGNSVYGNNRTAYIPKFMAIHSLNFFPAKGLTLTMGESIVYSDRLDIGYLIPIMFFKAYDHYSSKYNITAGSNGQFFLQASSRNFIPNTHVYSTVFIDEIRLSSIFDPQKSRNQTGFNIGVSVTDLIPYLTLGTEYTRINPFVYQNLIPTQTYTSHGYSLGDWTGNNADRFLAYIKYTPFPRVKTMMQVQKIRKGGEGTIEDQYFAEPQPDFLFDLQKKSTELQFRISYEWINSLRIQGSLISNNEQNVITKKTSRFSQFELGISFGL